MRSLRGQVAAIGIGESKYYKRGQSTDSEFVLTLKAILGSIAVVFFLGFMAKLIFFGRG